MDDIVSQESENFTQRTNNRSNSAKRGRKENTLRIGANLHEHSHHSRENDNDSVHSHASGKSKGKKAKETTLTRPKITHSPKIQKEDDSHSVHSNGSRHSHKSAKKENTIMQKPKIEATKKYQLPVQPSSNSNVPSFKDAWNNFEEESIINQYDRPDSKQASPLPMQKQTINHRQTKQTKISNAKFAPFADIEHHGSDDEPVIKLKQPADVYNKNAIVVGGYRPEEKPKRPEESRASIQESNVVVGESKLRTSKSKRRNIFDKSIQENASRVTNSIAESSISGLENTTRRSSSRRRQIFNSSRDKRDRQDSKDNKESRTDMLRVGQVPLESKQIERTNFKPAAHQNDRLVQIPKKEADNEDDFSLDESKSDLNLSTSNNMGKGDYKDRDSLVFKFEPEKKKGMTVASKDTKLIGRKTEVPQARNKEIVSIDRHTLGSQDLPKIGNTLVSKEVSEELKNVQQLLKANDEYLKQNEYLNANMKKKSSEGPGLFTLDDSDEEAEKPVQKPWHEIVTDIKQQQIIPIKTVTRNQTPMNQTKLQQERADRLRKQEQQARRQKEERQRQERERQEEQQRQRQRKNERENRKRKQQEQLEKRLRRERQEQEREEQRFRQEQQRRQKQRKLKKQAQRRKQQQDEQQQERQRIEAEKRQAQIFEKERIQKEKRRVEKKKKQAQARQRQEEQRLRQQQLQRQRIQMRRIKEQKKSQEEIMPKITAVTSTFSRDQSDNKSEQSNKSSKKANRKKETTLARPKNHKAYVKTQSPRAEESFYDSNASGEESKKEQIPEVKKQEKKPKLLDFSDDEELLKPKAKTDSHFFDYSQSQKSFKPPSSKPPLSKRTNGSVGGSTSKQKRPKQKTIAINVKNKPGKQNNVSNPKGQKKLTLIERAMMKHNESNDSGSEASCRDFSSDGSRRSNSSKQSKGSFKKQSTLQINQMIHSKQGKKLIQRMSSNDSSHEEELQTRQRRRQYEEDREGSQERIRRMKGDVVNQRMIVSKNCTFIDERGRLVQKDLVIKGRDVYGAPGYECSDQSVLDRMRRSRQQHRKRSTSRDKNRLSRKISRDSSENGSNQGISYASSNSFYENSGYYANNTVNNPLKDFIRPVEEVPNYNRQQQPKNQSGYNEGKTLNQMFGKKGPNKVTQQNPSIATLSGSRNSRRSLGRTEKSNSKRL